jgi:hypothetical protein
MAGTVGAEPARNGTGIWVVLTRYQPPNGYAIINVYGPFATKPQAIEGRRKLERRNGADPRHALVEYRVREIIRDEPGITS